MMLRSKLGGAAAATSAALVLCVGEEQRRSTLAARCAGWGSWLGFGGAAPTGPPRRQQLYAFGHGTDGTNSQLGAHHLHTLEPGDALLIPQGWWHSAQALTVSFSVSFWWNDEADAGSARGGAGLAGGT